MAQPTDASADTEINVNVDRVFDTCILLLTVLAATEFAYLAYILPATEMANLTQVNIFFRVTTTIILVLIVGWILASLIPKPPHTWKLGLLGRFRRRYVKEFCWCLFGNLFVYEIFTFVYYAFFSGESAILFTVYYILIFAFLLALPATLQYNRIDRKPNRKHYLNWLIPIAEHIMVFIISYLLIQQVMLLSVSIPVPFVPLE